MAGWSRNNKGRVKLFTVGVDGAKETLYFSRLHPDTVPGPGYCHFPTTYHPGVVPPPPGRNRRIAGTRSRVEHVFAQFAAMGGKTIRTIGLERARFNLTLKAAVYNMRRLVWLREAGIQPT